MISRGVLYQRVGKDECRMMNDEFFHQMRMGFLASFLTVS